MKQPKVILCSKSCSSHFGVAQLHIGTSNPYQKPILISFATLAADELSAIWQIFFRHQERRSTKPLPGRAGGKLRGDLWSGRHPMPSRHLELKSARQSMEVFTLSCVSNLHPMLYMCVIPMHCLLRHHLVQHKLPYEDINLMTWRFFLNRKICHNTLTRYIVVSDIFIFTPSWGRFPFWTSIFQLG